MVRVIRIGKIKMKKTVFFLIILCFSFSTYAYNMSDTSLRGTRSYWQGQDYEMSSKLFHIVLQKNYSDHEKSYAYLYLGMIALKQNNIEQAINYFNKSEKLYSTPYPNRIMYDFFTKQKKEKPKGGTKENEKLIRRLEREIEKQEEAVAQLDAGIEAAAADYQELTRLLAEKEAAENTLMELMEAWEEAMQQG